MQGVSNFATYEPNPPRAKSAFCPVRLSALTSGQNGQTKRQVPGWVCSPVAQKIRPANGPSIFSVLKQARIAGQHWRADFFWYSDEARDYFYTPDERSKNLPVFASPISTQICKDEEQILCCRNRSSGEERRREKIVPVEDVCNAFFLFRRLFWIFISKKSFSPPFSSVGGKRFYQVFIRCLPVVVCFYVDRPLSIV